MQRFKKFTMRAGNVDSRGQPKIFGREYGYQLAHTAVNRFGKFVYGANGTLTQAARWRRQMIEDIASISSTPAYYVHAEIIPRLSLYRDSIKRGGCYLP